MKTDACEQVQDLPIKTMKPSYTYWFWYLLRASRDHDYSFIIIEYHFIQSQNIWFVKISFYKNSQNDFSVFLSLHQFPGDCFVVALPDKKIKQAKNSRFLIHEFA
jgi:hypothetical protein